MGLRTMASRAGGLHGKAFFNVYKDPKEENGVMMQLLMNWIPNAGARLFIALLLLLHGTASLAEEGLVNGHQDDTAVHHYHKNVAGIFAGTTHAGRRENEPALGLEYQRRLNEQFGIGIVTEYTFGEADLWVVAIPVVFHTGHWKFYAGPGIEDGHHGTEELVRLGGEYSFEFSDGWEIAPQVNVDFVDGEEVWVFGVFFAKGF
jgi:hypothetical protein